MLAQGVLTLVQFFVIAMAVHLPFWLLGGKASFLGTCMAYIYGGGPYILIIAFAQWIMISAMPAELRRIGLNPVTAERAGAIAVRHPETQKFMFFVGMLIVLGVLIYTVFVTFRCLSFVHDLGGWRLGLTFVLSAVISFPIRKIFAQMSSLMHDAPPNAANTA